VLLITNAAGLVRVTLTVHYLFWAPRL
jgi:hypothetical protein